MNDSTRHTPYAPARGGRKGLLPKRTREEVAPGAVGDDGATTGDDGGSTPAPKGDDLWA